MRWILLFYLFLTACSDASRPENVLPQDKMGAVLYDVIQADEMVDFLKMSDSTYQPFTRRTALYDTVFKLHKIKKETFQQSLSYYQSRPDLLKEILEDLHQKVSDTSSAAQRRLRIERMDQ